MKQLQEPIAETGGFFVEMRQISVKRILKLLIPFCMDTIFFILRDH